MKQYTFEELNQMSITKGELFAELKKQGIEFDYALPENWVDEFVEYCQENNPVITYRLVISTTVWGYGGSLFGGPVFGCVEVQEAYVQYTHRHGG